jgi:hypothetical protein
MFLSVGPDIAPYIDACMDWTTCRNQPQQDPRLGNCTGICGMFDLVSIERHPQNFLRQSTRCSDGTKIPSYASHISRI